MNQLTLVPAEEAPIKKPLPPPPPAKTERVVAAAPSAMDRPMKPKSMGGPAWPVSGIGPPPWWPSVTSLSELSPYAKRVMEHRKNHAEKVRAALNEDRKAGLPRVPPLAAEDLLDITVVEGKSLGAWYREVDKFEMDVVKKTPPGKLVLVDLTWLPGWVSWALDAWENRGMPTQRNQVKIKAMALQDQASGQERYADLDEKEAKELLEGIKPDKKGVVPVSEKIAERERKAASRKMEAAKKKREKAAALRAEAEEMLKQVRGAA